MPAPLPEHAAVTRSPPLETWCYETAAVVNRWWTRPEGPPRAAHVLYRPAINTRHWAPDSRGAKRLSTAEHSAPHDTAQERTQERTQIGVDRLGETSARRTRALEIRDQHAAPPATLGSRKGPSHRRRRFAAPPAVTASTAAEDQKIDSALSAPPERFH